MIIQRSGFFFRQQQKEVFMLPSIKLLIQNLHDEKSKLERENRELKQRLGYSHTTINDLRYSKKQLIKQLEQRSQ